MKRRMELLAQQKRQEQDQINAIIAAKSRFAAQKQLEDI